MCAGKKVAFALSLLLFSVAANAENCVKVGYADSTEAIVSGRITIHHKLPKGSEGRTGDGAWLILDQPLLAGYPGIIVERNGRVEPSYEGCSRFRKIAILPNFDEKKEAEAQITEAEAQITQIRKWNNKHVTIDGKLGRFGSALVSPSIFIEVTTIKKD
jgi:hypothetical protein